MRAKRFLVTRPAEDAGVLVAALKARGLEAATAPMLEIVYADGPPLELEGARAILFTSANGARAFARRNAERDVPVLAVGDASAREARALGFRTVESASGDVADLAALCRTRLDPAGGDLLHVAGSHVAGNLAGLLAAAGFRCRREVLYESRPVRDLPPAIAAALKAGEIAGVLFFSPRTADSFMALARRAGAADALKDMTAYCLSAAVAAQAGPAGGSGIWGRVMVAERPDQDSLLRLVAAERGS